MTQPVPRAAFPQIEESEATGALATTYTDMRATLRAPWVMFAARALARFGDIVPAAWQRAQPVFATRGLEHAADVIRAAALLEQPPTDGVVESLVAAGVGAADLSAIRNAVRALHYGNAKYVLLITAWSEGLQGRSSGGTDPDPDWDNDPLPTGPPADMPVLELVDPRRADPAVVTLLDDIVDSHLHHGPASDFRVLAGWPTALEVLQRDVLAPVVRTETYDAAARALFGRARRLVRSFPRPAGPTPREAAEHATDTERAAAVAMLSMFQRFILDVTIDMARAHQALEGTDPTRRNPFPP